MTDLLSQLRNLRDNGPRFASGGICINVDWPMPELVDLMAGWPEHSGDRYYPVPHPEMPAHTAFARVENLWTGPYGDARRRLLNWLIEQLEAQK